MVADALERGVDFGVPLYLGCERAPKRQPFLWSSKSEWEFNSNPGRFGAAVFKELVFGHLENSAGGLEVF